MMYIRFIMSYVFVQEKERHEKKAAVMEIKLKPKKYYEDQVEDADLQLKSSAPERETSLLTTYWSIIIVMISWTGLAPWEFEFLFPGSLTSAFLSWQDDYAAERSSPVGSVQDSFLSKACSSQVCLLLYSRYRS